MEEGGRRCSVWAATQNPWKIREIAARYLGLGKSGVHIMGMPVGGGFGAKISNRVSAEAAYLAKIAGAPVKVVYNRKNQFQHRGSYKAAVLVDISTGVGADGKIIARKIDSYQDVGSGTLNTYDIPHVLTQLYKTEWPFPRAISRGTSFVQNCFATESNMDMVAAAIGMDPVEFRRKNVLYPAFIPLLDACAELIGYDTYQAPPDEGIGFALIVHSIHQLGVVGAEVAVNRTSGKIRVKRLCGAFDIGTVINRRMCEVGIRGAMTWGIGYALTEKIKLDGHSAYTENLGEYGIPRFSDIPPIDMVFLDNHHPGAPRGCGEMPMIPTIGAIANAVYRAVGKRFRSTPLTPDLVRKKLNFV
jgi:isoquinoline 1-oxidoreductase